MLGDGALTFQEFMMNEPVPLAAIQQVVLEYLRGREDAALFGAQAVNAYVAESRMSDDVDVLAVHAKQLAEELKQLLHDQLRLAVRVRTVKGGLGYRVYQVRKPKNRHLVDVRAVEALPATQRIADILVLAPADLVAAKVVAYVRRRGKPKAWTDRRDIAMLLLTFPELKREGGDVEDRLRAVAGSDESVMATWGELVREPIVPAEDDDDF